MRRQQGAVMSGAVGLGPLGAMILLDARHHSGDQNEEWRPHREGVVLLIGRDGKEDQRPGRKKAEQPDRARAEGELGEIAGYVGARRAVQKEIDGFAGVVRRCCRHWWRVFQASMIAAGRKRLQGKSQTRCSSQ